MSKIKSVREQVSEHIIHMIKVGQLKDGDKINITELQENLGISRPPINEALIELTANGVLDNVNRKGFYVHGTTPKHKHDTMETVAVLDSYVLRNLIVHNEIPQEVLDKLRNLVSEMDTSIKYMNQEDYYNQQESFHQLYLSCFGNDCIKETIASLHNSAIRTTASFETEDQQFEFFRKANKEHAELVECIEKGNAEKAEEIAMTHWLIEKQE